MQLDRDQKIGVAVGAGLSIAGIATCSVLDRIIDVTSHAHNTAAYKAAGWPTRLLVGTAVGLGVLALGTQLSDRTEGLARPLGYAAAGAGVAFGLTIGVRLGWGLLVAPAQPGWKPGMVAHPDWRIGDMAANSIDRFHMMGKEMNRPGNALFNVFSRVQGHGPIAERAGDFVPLLHDELPRAVAAAAALVS